MTTSPRRSGRSKPTVHDVASRAGVSIKTVSRVANGDPDVATATAARVRAAIDELGWRANPIARSLRTGRDEAIGLVVESISDAFFAAVTETVELATRQAGLFLMVAAAGHTPAQERAVVLGLLNRSVQGLIVVPCHLRYDQEHLPIGRNGIPVVFIDRPPGTLDADTVLADNVAGFRRSTEHLLDFGHRRIAFVGAEVKRYPIVARLAGYRDALEARRLDFDPALVVSHPIDLPEDQPVLDEVLADPRPATAVVCANAISSVRVVRELHRRGRTDVAMVSFDDFPVADALDPPISVACQDPVLMGRQAFALLQDRLRGDTTPSRRVVLPTTFVARGSGEVAPP